MKTKTNFCESWPAAAIFVATLVNAAGQAPEAQPTPPLLQRAGSMAAWTVQAKSKGGSPRLLARPDKANPFPHEALYRTRAIEKTDNLLHETATGWDGKVTEQWTHNVVTFRRDPVSGKILVLDPRAMRFAPRYDLTDFTGLDWLEPQHFVRSEVKDGEKCLLFEWKERIPSPRARTQLKTQQEIEKSIGQFAGKPTQPTKVWISVATRLPVAKEDDSATYTYKFGPPPTVPLNLPAEFQGALEQSEQAVKETNVHRMPEQP